MPPKPRPHGKKKPRAAVPKGSSSGRDSNRLLMILAIGGAAVLALIGIGAALALGGGDDPPGDARAALEAAGCTLSATPALEGVHSITTPDGTSPKWNTDPPTSGPHYQVPAVWGVYDDPVNQAQLVHNLEHGGVAIQYGSDVPAATVQQLKAFAQEHPRGTTLAPYPSLGDQIALGAWVTESASEPEKGTAYLAKCPAFDEAAFAAFLDAYQFRGPERFPPDTLLPGRT
jgi:hypothetical protein